MIKQWIMLKYHGTHKKKEKPMRKVGLFPKPLSLSQTVNFGLFKVPTVRQLEQVIRTVYMKTIDSKKGQFTTEPSPSCEIIVLNMCYKDRIKIFHIFSSR